MLREPSAHDRRRARFAAGDEVSFSYRRRRLTGLLLRTNPKRAVVEAAGDEYTVPYEQLETHAAEAMEREQRIIDVYTQAWDLMQKHGLKRWRFQFDNSARRAGVCYFRDRIIGLSFELARSGRYEDIRDTLLHEIAHALVGRKHHHDAVWQAKALQIGCSGQRTHSLQIAPPRWKVTCENKCWHHTAHRRNSRLVCRLCGSILVYAPVV